MQTKRIEYIDAMRGFTMILVVYSHILLFSYHLKSDVFTYNDIFVKFRMPLFFFISGWVLYKADRIWNIATIKSFLSNKFRVQIVSTAVFFLLFCFVFDYSLLKGLMNFNKLGYWFTLDLFSFYCIYSLSQFLVPLRFRENNAIGDIVVVCIMIIVMVLSYSYSVFSSTVYGNFFYGILSIAKWKYYVFFIMGLFVRKYFKSFVSLTNNKYFIGFIIVTFVVLLCLENKLDSPIPEKVLFVAYGLLGVIIVFTFFRKYEESFIQNKRLGYALQYIGRRTLDIYLIHYFIVPRNLNDVGSFFGLNCNPSLEFFVTLVLSLLVILICLVISSLIRLSPALSYYLLGVKK